MNKKIVTSKAHIISTVPIITLNVNGLNIPIKKQSDNSE